MELITCKPDSRDDFGIPDPDDLMRYTVRNIELEKIALQRINNAGLTGESGDSIEKLDDSRLILNFLGTHMPSLRREGWKIEFAEKIGSYMDSLEFATPVVHINDKEGSDWFDVGFDFEDGQGSSLSHADIQRAVQMGDSFITKGNKTILIDSSAITSMQDVFSDCASGESDKPGYFRMKNIFSAFVKSSLDTLDGIDVEDTKTWRIQATRQNRTTKIEPVALDKTLDAILRPYQKEGVSWMRFLQKNSFCGILADEMGLGKTLQTLTWLKLIRANKDYNNKPALIVCPTSLVENWVEETSKFVPNLKSLVLTGSDRHDKWDLLSESDIAVTSYAILRRDIDNYVEHEFSVAILDEAQHIKNRSTNNAKAAKRIKADSRLVLTGTPVENSVSDLWSIMDFLMPGYLGSHETFKYKYEVPITKGEEESVIAQKKLRRKLHPFLLRRLKIDVAKDLPAKIEKVSLCPLTKDQQMVYNEILKSSQQKISGMVSNKGFNKSRMEILVTLMRLRQVCCHLDLLKLENLNSKYPSAKLDMFFELLEEAVDGGHRILVFSQFVSMLTILRKELERQAFSYCYLDGSTKNRMAEVKKFNTQRDIPVFLISLKAGGTGLNLTGADMVIHFDPWWNPAVEDQATDRAHRIGQKRTVYSVKLISKGTVEEKVLAMQKKKKAIINATIESDEKMMQNLSWEDIQELLEL
ncbi:SNF2-related protein [Verrucomicrobiota bacterium]